MIAPIWEYFLSVFLSAGERKSLLWLKSLRLNLDSLSLILVCDLTMGLFLAELMLLLFLLARSR